MSDRHLPKFAGGSGHRHYGLAMGLWCHPSAHRLPMTEPRFTIAQRRHNLRNFGRHKSGWVVHLDGDEITIAFASAGEAFRHMVKIRQLYEAWGWLNEPVADASRRLPLSVDDPLMGPQLPRHSPLQPRAEPAIEVADDKDRAA